jgi:hypothetical protein
LDFKKGGLVVAAQKRNTKPTVDAVDENMNVKVEQNVDVEKVVKNEKPLDKDDVIEVVSLIPNISYKDKKYGDIYRWEKTGEIVEMTFDVINYMHQNHKTYFKSMWIKPLDGRVIKKFGLEPTYRDYDFLMDASNYTRKNVKEICDSIRKTPQSLKFAICNKIKSLVSSGEISDIHILREIEKSLNIDLIPLIG